jgi:hypothetical protein
MWPYGLTNGLASRVLEIAGLFDGIHPSKCTIGGSLGLGVGYLICLAA